MKPLYANSAGMNGVQMHDGRVDWIDYAPLPVVSLGLGLIGAAVVTTVGALMATHDVFRPLRYCGRNSIVIYLAFFLPMAATRTLCCSRPS